MLLIIIVNPGGFSKNFTINLALQCRAFSMALKIEKLKAPPPPFPGGYIWLVHCVRYISAKFVSTKNFVIAGVNESMLSLMP